MHNVWEFNVSNGLRVSPRDFEKIHQETPDPRVLDPVMKWVVEFHLPTGWQESIAIFPFFVLYKSFDPKDPGFHVYAIKGKTAADAHEFIRIKDWEEFPDIPEVGDCLRKHVNEVADANNWSIGRGAAFSTNYIDRRSSGFAGFVFGNHRVVKEPVCPVARP